MSGADRRAVRSKLLGITSLFVGVLSIQAGAVRSCGVILGHCSALDSECCGNIRDKQLIRPGGSRSPALEPTEPVRGAWFVGHGYLSRLSINSESAVLSLSGSAGSRSRVGSGVDRRGGRPAALGILRQLLQLLGAGSRSNVSSCSTGWARRLFRRPSLDRLGSTGWGLGPRGPTGGNRRWLGASGLPTIRPRAPPLPSRALALFLSNNTMKI
jgi:hypothetical protein